jgi:hypothetical protein
MLIMAKIRPNDLPIKMSALTEGISGAAAPYPDPNNKANKRGKKLFGLWAYTIMQWQLLIMCGSDS